MRSRIKIGIALALLCAPSVAQTPLGPGVLFISDQESRNGTFLNDSRLKEAALTLNPKDRIRVDDCIFEVVAGPGR